MASLKKLSYNFVVKFVREKLFCAYSKNMQTITTIFSYLLHLLNIALKLFCYIYLIL